MVRITMVVNARQISFVSIYPATGVRKAKHEGDTKGPRAR